MVHAGIDDPAFPLATTMALRTLSDEFGNRTLLDLLMMKRERGWVILTPKDNFKDNVLQG